MATIEEILSWHGKKKIFQVMPPRPPDRSEFIRTKEKTAKKAAIQLAKRSLESLNLYTPLPHIEKFHACRAKERILRGSNRGGKTLGASAEIARAVTGQDPYHKYPTENGRCFIVGKDGGHNAQVLFRKLCRRGAFKLIQDEFTRKWRPWRPWMEADAARENDTRDAPPLIPPRLIQDIAWESLKEKQPKSISLKNGWELTFYSSKGSPPQGSDVDLVWFDEEIVDPEWYSEVAARGCVDRNGSFIWSATAQKGGAQLYDMYLRAEAQRGLENPSVVEFFAHIDDNSHFSNAQRERFFEQLTDEQRRIRIDGEFAFTSYKVYPEFNVRTHCIEPFPLPEDACFYMVTDPGRQVCANLFAALMPPSHEYANNVILYDERYIRNCDSNKYGETIREATQGKTFRAFVIDYHGARVRSADTGEAIEMQYAKALKEHGVESETTGSGFIWGSSDVAAGISKFRSWLNSGKNRGPKVLVFAGALPNFEYEIQRYHYKKTKDGLTDQPHQHHNHLMDCCRYLAMLDPKYHRPKRHVKSDSPAEIMRKKREKNRGKHGPSFISLG